MTRSVLHPSVPPFRRFRRRLGVWWWLPALLCAALLGFAGGAWAQFDGDFALHKYTLDAENFLDWKAYQHPVDWRYARYTAPNLLDGSVGSLSQKIFYEFEQVRLQKALGRYGSVLYSQREDSFYRPDPIYREIELRVGRGWYASVVGFPEHDKINGSQGIALAWGERTDWNYVRFTHLRQYALHNDQTTGAARFLRAPELDRLEARVFWRQWLFVQLQWREERPTDLFTPDAASGAPGLLEHHEGRKADLVLDLHWSPRLLTGLTLRRRLERRARTPLAGAADGSAARQQMEMAWSDAYAAVTVAGDNRIEAGVYRGAFRDYIAANAAAERLDHHLFTNAAYVLWSHPRSEWFRWLFSFQGGRADLVTHDGAKPAEDVAERSTQLKAGVGAILQQAGSYYIFFNTTWDLDIFTHRQWDGGNIQLLFLF